MIILNVLSNLKHQEPPALIHTFSVYIPATNRTVKSHDEGNRPINLLRAFCFVCLDVPGRVGADEDVVHVPPQDGMPAVAEALGALALRASHTKSNVGGILDCVI